VNFFLSNFYALKLQTILPYASACLSARIGFTVTALEPSGFGDVICALQHYPYSWGRDKILLLCMYGAMYTKPIVLQTLNTATHVNRLYTDVKKIKRLWHKDLNNSMSQVAWIRTSNIPT